MNSKKLSAHIYYANLQGARKSPIFEGFFRILLSRLLFITEGKYWNQLKKFRKFRVVLSSGRPETGSRAKKVTASDSAKPGPHIHIIFFESGVTGTCRNGDKGCVCVCFRYKIAQTLQERSCILRFETVLGMNKKKKNFQKIFQKFFLF